MFKVPFNTYKKGYFFKILYSACRMVSTRFKSRAHRMIGLSDSESFTIIDKVYNYTTIIANNFDSITKYLLHVSFCKLTTICFSYLLKEICATYSDDTGTIID